jgi:predicted RNA-binding protein with PIN domain
LTPEEIKKILDQYFIMMKEDKVQQKEGLYVVNDLFNGSVFLKQKDSYLVGVFNTNSEETATNYINKVIEKFP